MFIELFCLMALKSVKKFSMGDLTHIESEAKNIIL